MMKQRPALRWHGGKWRLAPWIISHFTPHRVYTEAFGGAASVLLRKPRCYSEVYNDLDAEVVNLFRVLREPAAAKDLQNLLRLTPFARAEFEVSYLPSADPVEQARRTVVRSFMGFGSNAHNKATGFRANSNWSGTTPAHDWAHYPDALPFIIERLQGVVIENRPAADVLTQHDRADCLHYMDPPYVHDTREKGQLQNYRFEMTDEQHRDLAAVAHSLVGGVVVSGYPCALYDELYRDWQKVERAAHADGAKRRTECLWLSPAVTGRLQQCLPLEAL